MGNQRFSPVGQKNLVLPETPAPSPDEDGSRYAFFRERKGIHNRSDFEMSQ